MSASLARRSSPRALAWASRRGTGGHAPAEEAVDHEVEGEQVGQLVAVDLEAAVTGRSSPGGRPSGSRCQPVVAARRADPDAQVGVAALVAGAGAHDRAHGPGRSSRWARLGPGVQRAGRSSSSVSSRGGSDRGRGGSAMVSTGAGLPAARRGPSVGGGRRRCAVEPDPCLYGSRRHERGPVDAVGRGLARGREAVEAGVAGQASLDHGGGEGASGLSSVGVHDGDRSSRRACPAERGELRRRPRRRTPLRDRGTRWRPRASAALASMSRPVRTKVMVLR